jgi:hypothetical protein
VQLAPDPSQSRHANAYCVGEPDHVPVDAITLAPWTGDPEIAGGVMLDGLGVRAETASVESSIIVATTPINGTARRCDDIKTSLVAV